MREPNIIDFSLLIHYFIHISIHVGSSWPEHWQDAYRRNLPDSYLFKFFQEAQNHFGVKTWAAEELGNIPVKPLKAGLVKGSTLVECMGNCNVLRVAKD